jgi:histidine ammonia-lyase
MVTQYTAASMVSQNKQFCTPSSVDTIDSSNGQEDHVSMGANAALKTLAIVQNLERILAIELFNASQAMEFRKPIASSSVIEKFLAEYRDVVPFVKEDKVMHQEIEASLFFIQNAEPVN